VRRQMRVLPMRTLSGSFQDGPLQWAYLLDRGPPGADRSPRRARRWGACPWPRRRR
jgi:hypothetical protein